MKSICFAILSTCFFASSSYSVPPVINYAGQVGVGGEAFDGEGFFKFAIVNDSGSITYWSNDGNSTAGSEPTASVSVSVSGGLYSVLLGNSAIQGMNEIDPAVFQQNGDAKLRVWFNDGTNGFQQLTPDRPFASVPYALSSGSAESVEIAPGSIQRSMLDASFLAELNSSISEGSITRSMLESSILNDLNESIPAGSITSSQMDPNLVRYFVPEISSNPIPVSVLQGAGTTLYVQANGRFLTYQWQRNGLNLAGETNASLVLSDANASVDDANYSVVITNDWGSVTSPLARVTVATALPTITLNGAASITHEAATSYTDAGATSVDALGNDLNDSIVVTGADVNISSVGTHNITYSVTDAGGNNNSVTRTVTVQDTTVPIISLSGESNFTHNLNTAWVDPGYDANDTLDGNITASVTITGTVDVNTTGTYTLNYSVSDTAGNQADINRTVNVAPMGPWTFTNAGATGRFGPTQAQINTSYAGTSLEGSVTINSTHQGIQEWTVPTSGTYRIEVFGAAGGTNTLNLNNSPGRGAVMKGNFTLTSNDLIKILVGQKGEDASGTAGSGGGTFVTESNNNPLIIAGGGSGGHRDKSLNLQHGVITTSGVSSLASGGTGGTNGEGGNASGTGSGGGAGLTGNPTGTGWNNGTIPTAVSFVNGGTGGGNASGGGNGGFGGGAGSHNSSEAGGAGGYSGGGTGSNPEPGGGGGSYNSGSNQDNEAGVSEGHGKVIITFIGN